MKHIPILFNTEMVRAIDEDRKTVTRRMKGLKEINKYPYLYKNPVFSEDQKAILFEHDNGKDEIIVKNPYGKKGDILWCKETIIPETDENDIIYKADLDGGDLQYLKNIGKKWKPSIFMPKEACRIFLEVTDVKIERLQDISKEDAIAEGIKSYLPNETSTDLHKKFGVLYKFYGEKDTRLFNPLESFVTLWIEINGHDSFVSNPWVWVIHFKKTDKPQNWPV